MMVGMIIVVAVLVVAVVVAVGVACVAVLHLARRSAGAATLADGADELIAQAIEIAVAEANAHAVAERDQAVRAAVEHLLTVNREQVGAQVQAAQSAAAADLGAKQELIGSQLGQVKQEVHADIDRLTALVQQLHERHAEQFGRVDRAMQAQLEVTQTLSSTAHSLREALASSNARGQWGERMAEDVLRLAGMAVNVNYLKRTSLEGDAQGIPDFTFLLPKGHVLFMDVKFPMAAYLKFLEATTDAERSAHRATFLRDVRLRVKELARRDYTRADTRPAVDNVLLFVPNETLSAFIHESDPSLVEDAMRQNIVLCSPLTLFAFLGVIRQAFDNFVVEQTSDEILRLLGKFSQQWGKYADAVDKVKRQFDSVQRSFDELAGTRRKALERPLREIEALRLQKGLPVDGELFTAAVLDIDGYREVGA